ncbi:MAG: hypothetical protein JSS74_04105 [Actinobacteria bacterium]|nr:hypothetical protein [Actinomycetota bacterium]
MGKPNESLLAQELTDVNRRLRWVAHPVGLSDDELRGSGRRQDAVTPVPVSAWIPHQVLVSDPQLVQAVAIAWTRDAVLVRWSPPGSPVVHHTWVWASAVTRVADG